MTEGFDRMAEYDKVRQNGHDHDCAVGIVCHAAPCSCGCVPRWVTSGKLYQRWKYQTKRSTHQGGAMPEPSEREKEIIRDVQEIRKQYLGKHPIITVGRDLSIDEIEWLHAEMANHTPCVIVRADLELQVIPPCTTVEDLAKFFHESEMNVRRLVHTFQWDRMGEEYRGQRIKQAQCFLDKYIIIPREA